MVGISAGFLGEKGEPLVLKSRIISPAATDVRAGKGQEGRDRGKGRRTKRRSRTYGCRKTTLFMTFRRNIVVTVIVTVSKTSVLSGM